MARSSRSPVVSPRNASPGRRQLRAEAVCSARFERSPPGPDVGHDAVGGSLGLLGSEGGGSCSERDGWVGKGIDG